MAQLEVYRTVSNVRRTLYANDAHFLRYLERDTIEQALNRYHVRFKRNYEVATYYADNGNRHVLTRNPSARLCEPEFEYKELWGKPSHWFQWLNQTDEAN